MVGREDSSPAAGAEASAGADMAQDGGGDGRAGRGTSWLVVAVDRGRGGVAGLLRDEEEADEEWGLERCA